MLDRFFELLIVSLTIFLASLLILDKLTFIYRINFNYQNSYIQFMTGRNIMEYLTNYITDNTCNLTLNNFNSLYIDNLSSQPYEIIYENLSNGQKFFYGENVTNNYIEFRRVCFYDHSLYLVEVLVS
ncbi:hypothetical protein MJ1_0759 [Nanobdella aerobiophila]|uniref:Uncharacterized protein n=1 Tax=Nanobdella aerobiophila TaxID=2586965 RepID=A0A915SD36_9ARCH|nr:hypothetical protein [Nanobdella aerobiophila]BBL45898.1 hypothetical protein MJ1_0759 [Nanobdella aerobiophila]